jgi:hypothetical protein
MSIRALTMYDHVPAGCILRPVTDDDSAPHLLAGEFAIVDTTNTEPQHGEVYLVRFHRRGRWPNPVEEVFYIQQIMVRHHRGRDGETFIGFWMQCLNFEPYRETGLIPEISHRSMAFPVLKEALIGRIIGIYKAEDKAARDVVPIR